MVKLSEEDLAHWRRTGGGMKEKLQSIDWKNLSYVSITLVVINVIVFLVSENDGGRLLEAGTLNIEGVLKNKEYARFVWYMFLHGGIEHIFNNMVMLYFMGTMIEKEIGHLPYMVIYFLSGIGGGMFSLYMKVRLMNPVGSVGASAAIFGLDGLLLSINRHNYLRIFCIKNSFLSFLSFYLLFIYDENIFILILKHLFL